MTGRTDEQWDAYWADYEAKLDALPPPTPEQIEACKRYVAACALQAARQRRAAQAKEKQ